MVAKIVDLRKGGKKAAPETKPLPLRERGKSRRTSPLRVRRRRIRIAGIIGILSFLIVSLYGVHALSYMAQFNIQKISITGAERVEPDTIRAFIAEELRDDRFNFLSRSNIFIYPREILEKDIVAAFPYIKTAYITRPDPLSTEIVVAIGERQLYAKWCAAPEDCYALDDAGYIFAPSTLMDSYATPYVFTGGVTGEVIGKTFIPGHLSDMLTLLRLLQSEARLMPLTVEKSTDEDYTIGFAEGFLLKASFGTAPEAVARNLELVLTSDVLREKIEQLEYVDLRFGNRVYYKFKGEEQQG